MKRPKTKDRMNRRDQLGVIMSRKNERTKPGDRLAGPVMMFCQAVGILGRPAVGLSTTAKALSESNWA